MSYYPESSMRAAVREMVAVNGLRAWCRQYDLSPSMVSDYIASETMPCAPSIARALGYAPIRLYTALPVLSDADRSTPVEHVLPAEVSHG